MVAFKCWLEKGDFNFFLRKLCDSHDKLAVFCCVKMRLQGIPPSLQEVGMTMALK
ncbi:MAG: hypothetical protein V1902_03710 [Candidatus Falkowbacteria bacterium]